jgi:fructose-1,6-bisphosphatase I
MQATKTTAPDLGSCLRAWADGDELRVAIAQTVAKIAVAGVELAVLVRRSLLSGNGDGDGQRNIGFDAHQLMLRHLANAPVAAVATEEAPAVTMLHPRAPLLLAVDPLEGSADAVFGTPAGLLFSIRVADSTCPQHALGNFLRPGCEQLAAGIVLFGPATLMAITVGDGTSVYVADESNRCFRLICRDIRTPCGTREFAINMSNARHWTPGVQGYIAELTEGRDGSRQVDFDMRWHGALVADAYRVLTRGGIYLDPEDTRPAHSAGRVSLVFGAQPIAMLLEQAGGAATDGDQRLLDIAASHLHVRTPLVFGSADKVARVARYRNIAKVGAEHAPLFATRGLFREVG